MELENFYYICYGSRFSFEMKQDNIRIEEKREKNKLERKITKLKSRLVLLINCTVSSL